MILMVSSAISHMPVSVVLIMLIGSLKNPELVPTEFSFHTSINNIQGVEKQRFIEFVKWMIKWRAEERSTAKELLDDPWLY